MLLVPCLLQLTGVAPADSCRPFFLFLCCALLHRTFVVLLLNQVVQAADAYWRQHAGCVAAFGAVLTSEAEGMEVVSLRAADKPRLTALLACLLQPPPSGTRVQSLPGTADEWQYGCDADDEDSAGGGASAEVAGAPSSSSVGRGLLSGLWQLLLPQRTASQHDGWPTAPEGASDEAGGLCSGTALLVTGSLVVAAAAVAYLTWHRSSSSSSLRSMLTTRQ